MQVKIILPPTPRYSYEKEFVEKAGGKNRAQRRIRQVGHSLQAQYIYTYIYIYIYWWGRGGVDELKVDRVCAFYCIKNYHIMIYFTSTYLDGVPFRSVACLRCRKN